MAYSLPRADQWEYNENSNAMGFDAVQSFNQAPVHYFPVDRNSPYFSENGESSTLMVPYEPENTNTMQLATLQSQGDGFVPTNDYLPSYPPPQRDHFEENKSLGSNDGNLILEEHAQKTLNPIDELPDPVIDLERILGICNLIGIDPGTLMEAYTELRGPGKPRNSLSYIGNWINAIEVKSATVDMILTVIIEGTKEVNASCSDLRTGCLKLQKLHTDSQVILNKHQDSIQNLVDQTVFLRNKTDQDLNSSLGFTNDRIRALEINLDARLEEVNRRLEDMALQQRGIMNRVGELNEHKNVHERGLLEISDKVKQSMEELGECTAIAKRSLETSTQSFAIARESQSESMRASRTVQQTTQEALVSLKERVDRQDSEIRSQRLEEVSRRLNDVALQQRNITDRVGELGEHRDIQEKGLQELNDKMERSMRELSECTVMATKSLETSAQSFRLARDLQTESMRASRTAQQTMQEALASLNERIDRQSSEIRSLHSMRGPIDYEDLLDRQRIDGDRTKDRISDLLTQLKTAHLEISDVRAEVGRKLQEIGRKLQEVSDSHGANHRGVERAITNLSNGLQTCQSEVSKIGAETAQKVNNLASELAASARSQSGTDRHVAEIKLLVTSLEAKTQSLAELMKDKLDTSRLHSALTDLQAQNPHRIQEVCQPDSLTAIISRSEGLTTEILGLERRIAETFSETNEVKAETLKCLVEIRAIETRLKTGTLQVETTKTRDRAHEPMRRRTARQDKSRNGSVPNPAALNDGSKSVVQRAQGLSKWFGPLKGKGNEQKGQVEAQECSEPAAKVISDAPGKGISTCDCVKLGCGTCKDHGVRIERLEYDLLALRSQLFVPDECELVKDTEKQQANSGNASSSQGHGTLPPQSRGGASELKSPGQDAIFTRGREGTLNRQYNDKPALRASSREFVVGKHVGGAETDDTIVRGVQRPKYSSTCYVNAAIQALFHVQGFSGFLEDNRFSRDHHPLLLQLQRLHRHCRPVQGRNSVNGSLSNKEIIDCLNSKGVNINPKKQEDSIEFFERLVGMVADETRIGTGWRSKADVEELLKANMTCTIACKECGQGRIIDHTHTTVHLEHTQAGQVKTTISKKVRDLLRRKETMATCTRCQRETRSENTFSYQMPESLFLKVARNIWDSKKNRMERTEQKVYPERFFDLKPEHQGHKVRYGLTGGIVHKGGANSGHYLNVLLISRKWYEIDDESVRIIPEKEAVHQLEGHGVLVMYQRERELNGNGTNPNKAVDGGKGSERKHTETEAQARQPTKGGRRHRFRPYRARGSNKPKKGQWRKTHITEHKGYYDPDKKCFYIPRP